MSFKLGSTAVVDFIMKEGFVAQRFHNYMILKVLIIF